MSVGPARTVMTVIAVCGCEVLGKRKRSRLDGGLEVG